MQIRPRRAAIGLLAVVLPITALTACSSSDDQAGPTTTSTSASAGGGTTATSTSTSAPPGQAPGREAAATALRERRLVIDVRTPDEYAAGHIAGAVNRDVQAGDFDQALDHLDPTVAYVVYCHSGRRSAIAAERMRTVGLDVLDGGGIADMQAGGWTLGA